MEICLSAMLLFCSDGCFYKDRCKMNDLELLRCYRESGSEEAFRELVERHLGMVYAVALRQVRNPNWAEEVAHAVFIALARKAGSISERTVLAGWLYRATRFAAGKLLRTEERRVRREKEAAMAHLNDSSTAEVARCWAELSPLVLKTLDVLSRKDRDVILMRFIENRSFAQVALAMGTTEAAAKMRTGRALEKLRGLLAKRGCSVTVAALSAGLASADAAGPSAGLSASISAAALGQATITASAAKLAASLISSFTLAKMKIAATVLAVMIASSAIIIVIRAQGEAGDLRASPENIAQRNGWVVMGRNVWPAFHQGRQAVSFDAQPGPGLAWREGFTFSEGVIEADIAAFAGHIGLAFWVQDVQHYSAIYFRPQNRPEDPVNGARGVQYVALPEYGWERLRLDKGGTFENSAALPPAGSGAWFHVRLEVGRTQVRAFIDDSTEPCLVINDVLTTNTTGSVGLFMGDGSLGIISNLKVSAAGKR
jgi:RNA polymerase sigma factor (sigma-70 family)